MIRALLVSLLLLASASAADAQPAPTILLLPSASGAEAPPEVARVVYLRSAPQSLAGNDVFAMIATGSLATLGGVGFAAVVDSPWPLAVAPLVSGFAVAAVGDGRGYEGSSLATVGGALLGGAAGAGLLYVSASRVNVFSGSGYPGLLASSLVYLTLPSVLGTVGYSATLSSQPLPNEPPVPTVGLRIGL